jgi:hypothetical protein
MRNVDATNGESFLPVLKRVGTGVLPIFFLGLIGLVIGLVVDRRQFFQSFLYGYIFWLGLSLGCFSMMMLHHIIRASWSLTILRILEAGTKVLPLMAGLFVVVAIGMWLGDIYPWTGIRTETDPGMRHVVDLKGAYLNPVFFLIRAVVYFAFWIGLSRFLNRLSLEQDRTGDQRLAATRTNWSAPGLVLHVLVATFAFTDWVMSLDPHWFSTIFGALFLASQALSAVSFATFLIVRFWARRPFSEIVTQQLTRDLGNMMFMLTLFWTYISLSQFLIIWSGNLPEETPYYVIRNSNGWLWVGVSNILLGFFTPFLILLSGRTKRTPDYLWKVAVLIFIMRVVDVSWIVIPFYLQAGWGDAGHLWWMCAAAWLGIGGIWLSVFQGHLRRSPLLARHSPRMEEVLEHA